MAYVIEVNHRMVTDYDADTGEWLDGDAVKIDDWSEVEKYDGYDAEEYGSPVAWAIARIGRASWEANISPIPERVPAWGWLFDLHGDPYGVEIEEVTVRVTGDFTDRERAEIFRAVAA
jgi:hypothetical protein